MKVLLLISALVLAAAQSAPGKYLAVHPQAYEREGRIGCSVTLTFLLPTDPVTIEDEAPVMTVKFFKGPMANPTELDLGEITETLTTTSTNPGKYKPTFDAITEEDFLTSLCIENRDITTNKNCTDAGLTWGSAILYHHRNVYTHMARLVVMNLLESDGGYYHAQVTFNGVTGLASTNLMVLSGACPKQEMGGSQLNWGTGRTNPNAIESRTDEISKSNYNEMNNTDVLWQMNVQVECLEDTIGVAAMSLEAAKAACLAMNQTSCKSVSCPTGTTTNCVLKKSDPTASALPSSYQPFDCYVPSRTRPMPMIMLGPWQTPTPDSDKTATGNTENGPVTTDERWVVESIQVFVPDAGAGNCLRDQACKEGLEVRVYELKTTTGVATLVDSAYFMPYGVWTDTTGWKTFQIVAPFRKEPLSVKKGQYLGYVGKILSIESRKTRGTTWIPVERQSLLASWELPVTDLGRVPQWDIGYCKRDDGLGGFFSDIEQCGLADWQTSTQSPLKDQKPAYPRQSFWISQAKYVSALAGTQNAKIQMYADFNGDGVFDENDFGVGSKTTVVEAETGVMYGFKAKMVFYETYYPIEVIKVAERPARKIVDEENDNLLLILAILIATLFFCCCLCCFIYGRQAKRLRERRMFMSSMLGQSFNISSETGEPLPPNWYEEKTPEGNIYYYNPTTQESMWDIPTFG